MAARGDAAVGHDLVGDARIDVTGTRKLNAPKEPDVTHLPERRADIIAGEYNPSDVVTECHIGRGAEHLPIRPSAGARTHRNRG